MFRLWHPLRDPYHCTYRMLTILRASDENTQSIARLSLLDLYFLFPHFISDLSMSEEMRGNFRKLHFPKRKDSFVYLPDIQLVYRELQQYQRTALKSMVARGLLDADIFNNGGAKLNINNLPSKLIAHMEQRFGETKNELLFIIEEVGALPIDGADGLLRQTGMEMGGRLS